MSQQSKFSKSGMLAETPKRERGHRHSSGSSTGMQQDSESPEQEAAVSREPSVDFRPFAETGKLIWQKRVQLEKRHGKLQSYSQQLQGGNALHEDRIKAMGEENDAQKQLDFVRDIEKVFWEDMGKLRQAVGELKSKEEKEFNGELVTLLRYKEAVAMLQDPEIRQRFRLGISGAVKLSEEELGLLDIVDEKINPDMCRALNANAWNYMLQTAATDGLDLVRGSKKRISGTVKGHRLKSLLERICNCRYTQELPTILSTGFPPLRPSGDGSTSRFLIGESRDTHQIRKSERAKRIAHSETMETDDQRERVTAQPENELQDEPKDEQDTDTGTSAEGSKGSCDQKSSSTGGNTNVRENESRPQNRKTESGGSDSSTERPKYAFSKRSDIPNVYFLIYDFYPPRFVSDIQMPTAMTSKPTQEYRNVT